MLKNYFIELGNIFKSSGIFFIKNFKKYNLLLWLLILIQMVIAIPALYFAKEIGFANFSVICKFVTILLGILFFATFFFMFKKVFNLASIGLEKDEISNSKIIKALLTLGLFNCIPFFAFLLCLAIAQTVPNFAFYIKIILNLFTYIFYFAMSLSIAAIVKWQNKNVFCAILKSLKTFFKKLALVVPVIFAFFTIASIIVFLISATIYAIAIYFKFITQGLIDSVHAIISAYALYIIAGLYIGAQIKILEGEDE